MFTIFRRPFISSGACAARAAHAAHSNSMKLNSVSPQSSVNEVLLVGTVHTDLIALKDGRKQFYLKTRENKVNL